MTDGLDTAPGDSGDMASLPGEGMLRLEASRSLAEIAGLMLDAAVPGFAAAATVFVMETLAENGRVPYPAGGGRLLARRLGTKLAALTEAPVAFPPGEVLAFAADSPYARCVRVGGPRSEEHTSELQSLV